MKKYKLNFADGAFVEYTEAEFNKLKDVDIIGLEETEVKAKKIHIKSPSWKYNALMTVPLENFEEAE